MSVIELEDEVEKSRGGMDRAVVTIVSQFDAVVYSQTNECFNVSGCVVFCCCFSGCCLLCKLAGLKYLFILTL